MKIVFLDVDGVLINGCLGWNHPDPACVASLNSLIERTQARIVVSSCWRIGRTVPELRELLADWGVHGTVVDRTGESDLNRGMEIGRWLEARIRLRGDIGGFVILDDDGDMGELLPSLVRTKFRVGLTDEAVEKAVDILSRV